MNKLFNLLFFLSFGVVFAQNPNRIFEKVQLLENRTLKITVNDGVYRIVPYNNNIIETTFNPTGEIEKTESHAVILEPKDIDISLKETANEVVLTTGEIVTKVQKSPFQIKYYHNNKLLISEAKGYVKNDSLETIDFNIKFNEILYGGGARALGMNRRGNRLKLYNKAHYGYETRSELMNYTMPIVVSSDKYLLHFDNAPIGFLDLDSKQNNHLMYETISGRKTYQIVAASTWPKLIDQYTNLTGKQPMPPRWALGNFASRFGYHSQYEVENTINKFKDLNVPVDAVILDLYWFGKTITGTMGNLEVFRDSFPDFEGMISRLKAKGVKTITITEPFVLTTSNRWKEAVKQKVLATDSLGKPYTYDFYFGNTGLIDIYNPKGASWFWSIYKGLREKGIVGIWGDLGEPEVHPTALKHYNTSADEVHNIYGHDWAGLIYKGYKNDFSEERPFILMRAGYSGSQRYGMIPWSGDVNRTWGGLQSQTEIALQMGLQGLGYMHSDLGGFAGDNLDDELYTRWLQYGVFQPIFRPHAQEEVPSEPVYRSEEALKLSKKAIDLRYALLPYNYHLVFENNTQGLPLMRPLFFEDSRLEMNTVSSTYFWGNDFLISPVTKAGQEQQMVDFPNTGNWYDFYSNKAYVGGKSQFVNTVKTSIPTFVRGGAIIPIIDPVQSTDEYELNNFQLHYYFDQKVKKSQRFIYNDNGLLANAYEKDQYELLKVTAQQNSNRIQMELSATKGMHFNFDKKEIELVVHNMKKAPNKVLTKNDKLNYHYDQLSQTFRMNLSWEPSSKKIINIKF
ncbi:MAG: TIM-barrel domain-containing protein [Flavobacteriaceae bacterium]